MTLNLDEILSTINFSVTKISDKNSFVVLSGDGAYSINGELTNIDQNNQPDYISYHLNEPFENVWETFTKKEFKNVEDISIMSDGIFSFKKEAITETEKPINSLLNEKKLIKSKAMLPRLRRILSL